MAYHISNLGSFAGSAGNPEDPAHYADLDGFVPQDGDGRDEFVYDGDAASNGHVQGIEWDEWVQQAVEATARAERRAQESDQPDIWQQALKLYAERVVDDIARVANDDGEEVLVRLDFANGDYMIAGEEVRGEAGFTYTLYDSEGEDYTTDGWPDLARLSDAVREIAKGAGR